MIDTPFYCAHSEPDRHDNLDACMAYASGLALYRVQTENRDRLDAATDAEKDEVLRVLNDLHPDELRDAMNAASRW